jgi:uncharacterized protein YjiS (DUF1127 family)
MTMTVIAKNESARFGTIRFSPLRWLMRLPAAYHQYRGLKEATPKRLDDMGISRKSANRAFYRQFADKKID